LQPVQKLLIFIADELGFAECGFNFGGQVAWGKGLGFGARERYGFAAAVEGYGWVIGVVAGFEEFAVEGAMAWTGSAVFDGGVTPEREVVFNTVECADLPAAIGERGVGAIDGVKVEGAQLCDTGFIKFFTNDVGKRFLGFAAAQVTRERGFYTCE